LEERRAVEQPLHRGADPGQEAKDAKLRRSLREALQCREDAEDQDAQRQRPHPADIVRHHAEDEAADRPTQQADRRDQPAHRADLRHRRCAADQFGQGLPQYQPVEREIGDVERPARPRHKKHEPLIPGNLA